MIPNKDEKGCTGYETLCILFVFFSREPFGLAQFFEIALFPLAKMLYNIYKDNTDRKRGTIH